MQQDTFQQQPSGFNLIFSILQSWKDQVDDQILEIKKNIYSISSKSLYYYTLELEIKNRRSLKLLIELSQQNEQHLEGIQDTQLQEYVKRFQEINFDDIPFVSVGTNVNQQKKLRLLADEGQNIWERLCIFSNQMKITYQNLEMEILGLTNQIGKCIDKKEKKLLVNQRYRKEENLYYFKLLVGTLNNLTLIYKILQKYQDRVPIQDMLLEELDQQIHDQMNQGMYIRTNATGRRDKTFLKITISCLMLIALYTNTSNYTMMEVQIQNQSTQLNDFYYEEESQVYGESGGTGEYSQFNFQTIGPRRKIYIQSYGTDTQNLEKADTIQLNYSNLFQAPKPLEWGDLFKYYMPNYFFGKPDISNQNIRNYGNKEKLKTMGITEKSKINTNSKINAQEIERADSTIDQDEIPFFSFSSPSIPQIQQIIIRVNGTHPEEFMINKQFNVGEYQFIYQCLDTYINWKKKIDKEQSQIEGDCNSINLYLEIKQIDNDIIDNIKESIIQLLQHCQQTY